MSSSVYDTKFFISSFWRAFKVHDEWPLFYCNSILVCRVIQNFGLCKWDDLWCHIADTKWCNTTKYRISVHLILSLQGWCATRTTHFDNSYDVTIATYLLPVLYLPKIKNCLICCMLQSLQDFLVLVLYCNVHISSHPLNKQQEQFNNTSWRRKLWFYLLNREGLEPIVLPWKCHSGNIIKTLWWVQQLYKVSVLYKASLPRYSIFCDFTSFCVHNMTSQVISINSATKSAFTIKQTPFFIILKALSNKLIKNFVSCTL